MNLDEHLEAERQAKLKGIVDILQKDAEAAFNERQRALKEGVKFDEGKARWDLLPARALWEVVEVYTVGAKKYEDWNWAKGMKYTRVISALLRHLFRWMMGQRNDQETGQHHLTSVVFCALTLLHYDLHSKKYTEFDDRFYQYEDGEDIP